MPGPLAALTRPGGLLRLLSRRGRGGILHGQRHIVKFKALPASAAIGAIAANGSERHHSAVSASRADNLHFWWWHILLLSLASHSPAAPS